MRVSFLVILASLMCMTTMSAQNTQSHQPMTYSTTGALIEVGDSVMISRDTTHYQTKEHIIHWAFNKVHIIRQVNSKYHPNSVLLKGIYSWISADAAIPLNRNKQYPYDPNTAHHSDEGNGAAEADHTMENAVAEGTAADAVVSGAELDSDDSNKGKNKKGRSKKDRGTKKNNKASKKAKGKNSASKTETTSMSSTAEAAEIANYETPNSGTSASSNTESVGAATVGTVGYGTLESVGTVEASESTTTTTITDRSNPAGDSQMAKTAGDSQMTEIDVVSQFANDALVSDMANVAGVQATSPMDAGYADAWNDSVMLARRDSLAEIVYKRVMDELAKQKEIDSLMNNVDRFSIGLRGGFASTMADPTPTMPLGYDLRFDLQYAHYWMNNPKKHMIGLMTGLSLGYMYTNRDIVWDEEFTRNTSDGDVHYHVTADNVRETNKQLQLEMPLMFSMVSTNGFYLNLGPRVLLPIRTPFEQVITNGHIVATDLETTDVMTDNVVYGYLNEDQIKISGMTKQKFDITVLVGMELGYEFRFASGNSVGLGVYANYGVYSTYSNRPLGTIIDVTAPNYDKIGSVDVYSMTDAYTRKMGHLDAGIKLSFNFDSRK